MDCSSFQLKINIPTVESMKDRQEQDQMRFGWDKTTFELPMIHGALNSAPNMSGCLGRLKRFFN
jgi:hypothetical protein